MCVYGFAQSTCVTVPFRVNGLVKSNFVATVCCADIGVSIKAVAAIAARAKGTSLILKPSYRDWGESYIVTALNPRVKCHFSEKSRRSGAAHSEIQTTLPKHLEITTKTQRH